MFGVNFGDYIWGFVSSVLAVMSLPKGDGHLPPAPPPRSWTLPGPHKRPVGGFRVSIPTSPVTRQLTHPPTHRAKRNTYVAAGMFWESRKRCGFGPFPQQPTTGGWGGGHPVGFLVQHSPLSQFGPVSETITHPLKTNYFLLNVRIVVRHCPGIKSQTATIGKVKYCWQFVYYQWG